MSVGIAEYKTDDGALTIRMYEARPLRWVVAWGAILRDVPELIALEQGDNSASDVANVFGAVAPILVSVEVGENANDVQRAVGAWCDLCRTQIMVNPRAVWDAFLDLPFNVNRDEVGALGILGDAYVKTQRTPPPPSPEYVNEGDADPNADGVVSN